MIYSLFYGAKLHIFIGKRFSFSEKNHKKALLLLFSVELHDIQHLEGGLDGSFRLVSIESTSS